MFTDIIEFPRFIANDELAVRSYTPQFFSSFTADESGGVHSLGPADLPCAPFARRTRPDGGQCRNDQGISIVAGRNGDLHNHKLQSPNAV